MVVRDIEDVIRVGSCNQCGQCCQRLGWLCVNADEETQEWIQAHDCEIKVVPDEDVKGYCWVSMPYKCRQMVDIGGGKFSCQMHDGKPLVCKQYPLPTDDLKPGCGYQFIQKD